MHLDLLSVCLGRTNFHTLYRFRQRTFQFELKLQKLNRFHSAVFVINSRSEGQVVDAPGGKRGKVVQQLEGDLVDILDEEILGNDLVIGELALDRGGEELAKVRTAQEARRVPQLFAPGYNLRLGLRNG